MANKIKMILGAKLDQSIKMFETHGFHYMSQLACKIIDSSKKLIKLNKLNVVNYDHFKGFWCAWVYGEFHQNYSDIKKLLHLSKILQICIKLNNLKQ